MPENSDLEKSFFDAVKKGRLDEVRRFLSDSPGLVGAFDYSEFGGTALNLAVWGDNREMVDLMLDSGADINLPSDFEPGPWPPIQLAIMCQKDDMAEYLAEKGAGIGAHEAAGLGRIDDLRDLLEHDIDLVNQRGGDGCFPLHFAKTPEIAALLLEKGADINARCIDHDSTALEYHASIRPEVAKYLMEQGAPYDLFIAIMAGDEKRFKEELAKPGALKLRIDESLYPKNPETSAMSMLYFSIGWNSTPLHAATKANRSEFVEAIIDAGEDVNIRGDYDDCTPLHMAGWWNRKEAAETLITRGAEIDIESGKMHQNTPAGWAIVAGSVDVLELLLENGAEIRDYFLRDAKLAADGEFRIYKSAPQEQYERALKILESKTT